MAEQDKGKSPAESFGEMVGQFGEAVGKIFDDPELKQKAREFGDSAVRSARHFGDRFRDDEVKEKFRSVGEAAREFGNSMSEYFKDEDKKTGKKEGKKKDDPEKKIEEKVGEFSGKTDKAGRRFGEKMDNAGKKVDSYFNETRGGRITGYAFAIFFSSLFLVFIYYYNQYIAFYVNVDGVWQRYPLLTGDFDRWLPVAFISLLAGIIGNIILIIYDSYFFRQVVHMVMDMFSLAAVISLAAIFPFDFSVMPGNDLSGILDPVVTVVLILICVGIGIGILVRFIKMMVSLARRTD